MCVCDKRADLLKEHKIAKLVFDGQPHRAVFLQELTTKVTQAWLDQAKVLATCYGANQITLATYRLVTYDLPRIGKIVCGEFNCFTHYRVDDDGEWTSTKTFESKLHQYEPGTELQEFLTESAIWDIELASAKTPVMSRPASLHTIRQATERVLPVLTANIERMHLLSPSGDVSTRQFLDAQTRYSAALEVIRRNDIPAIRVFEICAPLAIDLRTGLQLVDNKAEAQVWVENWWNSYRDTGFTALDVEHEFPTLPGRFYWQALN